MRKGNLMLLCILLISFFLVGIIYKTNLNSKLNTEEKKEIISIVNSYYDRIMSKDYKSALDLVNLSEDNYDKQLEIITGYKEYKIVQRLDGNRWVVPMNGKYDYMYYDKRSKCFIILTGVRVINNSDTYEATENVYVKRFGKQFKIVKITTDDRFGYIRGSFVLSAE
jgi:hypothetical protein